MSREAGFEHFLLLCFGGDQLQLIQAATVIQESPTLATSLRAVLRCREKERTKEAAALALFYGVKGQAEQDLPGDPTEASLRIAAAPPIFRIPS